MSRAERTPASAGDVVVDSSTEYVVQPRKWTCASQRPGRSVETCVPRMQAYFSGSDEVGPAGSSQRKEDVHAVRPFKVGFRRGFACIEMILQLKSKQYFRYNLDSTVPTCNILSP